MWKELRISPNADQELQTQRCYKRINNFGGGDLSTVAPNLLNRVLMLKSKILFG